MLQHMASMVTGWDITTLTQKMDSRRIRLMKKLDGNKNVPGQSLAILHLLGLILIVLVLLVLIIVYILPIFIDVVCLVVLVIQPLLPIHR